MQRRQNSYRQASTGSLRTAPPDPHSGGTWARLFAPWEVRLFFQSYSDVILRMVEIECAGQTVMPVFLGVGLWPVSSQNDLQQCACFPIRYNSSVRGGKPAQKPPA